MLSTQLCPSASLFHHRPAATAALHTCFQQTKLTAALTAPSPPASPFSLLGCQRLPRVLSLKELLLCPHLPPDPSPHCFMSITLSPPRFCLFFCFSFTFPLPTLYSFTRIHAPCVFFTLHLCLHYPNALMSGTC